MVTQEQVFTKDHVTFVLDKARSYSPCVRRKYGAIITSETGNLESLGVNVRLGNYCNDTICIRDYCKAPHGENVELGGEVHAEQAALISWPNGEGVYHFLLAGLDHQDKPLDGIQNYPCHVCAMQIKFAGFRTVWMPFGEDVLPVSIDEILEYYERRDD